jgi:hypothetical protein
MMDIVTFVRVATTLTFLMIAAFGPYAIVKLNRFIKRYTVAHSELEKRTERIEKHLGLTEKSDHDMD